MLYAIVGILVIILDQGVKYWVTTNLLVGSVTQPLIPGIISLIRLHNDGAAFSFLAGGGARIYFIILTVVFTVAVIIALATNFINGSFGRWCLVLVTAGGLSNCLDRVLYGYVVDMFKLDILPEFAVFNVADIFITVFAILFIVYIIFGNEDKKADEDEFDELDDEDADREPLRLGLKKNRKVDADDFDRAERPARERAAEAKAKKYRADDDEDEVSSPRFGLGRQRAAATADAAPRKTAAAASATAAAVGAAAARQGVSRPAAKRTGEDTSPAARRERALEGFGPKASAASQVQQRNKAQKTRYEEDYEQYKAAHPELNERPVRKSAAKTAAPTYDNTDPFAEWERANARVESGRASGATARAMGVEPSAAAKSATAESAEPARYTAPAAAQKPAATKPAAAPAPKTVEQSDDFSLDDILNEFK